MTPEPKRGIDHGSVILAHEARMDNFADELREMRREGREDRKQIHDRIRELEVSWITSSTRGATSSRRTSA